MDLNGAGLMVSPQMSALPSSYQFNIEMIKRLVEAENLPEPDSSELSFAARQCSDGDINPRLILFDPFVLKVAGVADGELSGPICIPR